MSGRYMSRELAADPSASLAAARAACRNHRAEVLNDQDGERCELCGEFAGASGHRVQLGELEMLRCDPAALRRARARRRASGQPEPTTATDSHRERSIAMQISGGF